MPVVRVCISAPDGEAGLAARLACLGQLDAGREAQRRLHLQHVSEVRGGKQCDHRAGLGLGRRCAARRDGDLLGAGRGRERDVCFEL